MREGERVRQREIGRDRDIAGSELRHNRRGLSSAQLNGQAYIALNEECETVRHRNQWVLCLAEGRRLKNQKVQCAARHEIWHMEVPNNRTSRRSFPPKRSISFGSIIPHKGALWEYHTSMEVSSHNPQEAFSPSCLLLVGCHHIHSPFPDRCL